MISEKVMRTCVAHMRLMRHFPAWDADVMQALMSEMVGICPDDEALRRLTKTLIGEFDSWPGIAAVRDLAVRLNRPRRSNAGNNPNVEWVPDWQEKIG